MLAQELTRALGLGGVFATAVGGAGSPALPQRGRGRVKTTQQWQQQTEAEQQPDTPAMASVVRESNGMGVRAVEHLATDIEPSHVDFILHGVRWRHPDRLHRMVGSDFRD